MKTSLVPQPLQIMRRVAMYVSGNDPTALTYFHDGVISATVRRDQHDLELYASAYYAVGGDYATLHRDVSMKLAQINMGDHFGPPNPFEVFTAEENLKGFALSGDKGYQAILEPSLQDSGHLKHLYHLAGRQSLS